MCTDITTILAALLTPTVAILAALIAYRQWRIAQNKLKLDLFDRRFKVYEAATAFLDSIMTSGKVGHDELCKFTSGVREAKWLLNLSVAEYLYDELRDKAIDLQNLEAEYHAGVGEVQTQNLKDKAEMKRWFRRQYQVLDQHFAPFLQLSH